MHLANQERNFARRNNWKPARLVAWIHVRKLDDSITRHVVVIERLAQLLRGIDRRFNRASGGLLDRRGPLLHCLLQGMGWRNPMRQLELNDFVLRRSRKRQRGNR